MGILQIQFRHDQLNQLKGPFQNQQQLTGIWTSQNLLLGIYFILAGVGSHKAALGIDPEHQGLRWDQTRSSAYTTTQKYNGNKEKQTKRSLSTRKRQRFPASNIQTRHYMVNYEVREEWDTKCNGNPKKHAERACEGHTMSDVTSVCRDTAGCKLQENYLCSYHLHLYNTSPANARRCSASQKTGCRQPRSRIGGIKPSRQQRDNTLLQSNLL